MLKKNSKYLFFILALFITMILFQHYAPKPVDWRYNFQGKEKVPYGCKVLKDMLPVIFPGKKIITHHSSLYRELKDVGENKNLIIITERFQPDVMDQEKMLEFVRAGNNVFIASLSYGKSFSNSLGFQTKTLLIDSLQLKGDTTIYKFLDPKLEEVKYEKILENHFFSRYDSTKSLVIGVNGHGKANFTRIKEGKGYFFIHCQPLVFTNYHLLYSSGTYPCIALSYLPVQISLWDEYYKPNKTQHASPVKFILSKSPLRIAYYLVLLGILIYMLFESKRKQRIIPIIPFRKNSSLEFIHTLGRLYYHKRDYKDLVVKKMIYFNDRIRSKYYIFSPDKDEKFYKILAAKSGVNEDLVKKIYKHGHQLTQLKKVNEKQLIYLNNLLHEFKMRSR
ncbi:MAG: DUF4350 domain-containing protein [Bacteroidota bacterium]